MSRQVLVFSHAAIIGVNRGVFRALEQTGRVTVTLVCPERWKGDLMSELKFKKEYDDGNLKIIRLPVVFRGNGSIFFYKRNLRKVFGDYKPDIIFLDEEPWSLAALQVYFYFPKVKKVFFTKQNLKKCLPPPFSWIERKIFKNSEFAFAISKESEEVLRQKGFKGRTVELPHSYDPKLFTRLAPEDRARVRTELNLSPEDIVFCYLGRLTVEKGIHVIIKATRRLIADRGVGRIKILFVGTGPLSKVVKRFAQEIIGDCVRVHSAIHHDQVGRVLGACDVLILPSLTTPQWKEQFGRVLIEALGCHVALIGSSSGEIPVLIKKTNGGFICKEGSSNSLAEQMTTFLDYPETIQKLADVGQAYVESNYTHQKVAEYIEKNLRDRHLTVI